MIGKIDHIGVAVRQLETHIPFYRDVLKLDFRGIEEVPEQKVRVAMFGVGESQIELLEPTDPSSPIASFLESRGEGMHHIAYQTGDIEGQVAELKGKQIQMIDSVPRAGAHGTRIAFIHPKSSGKVLTEICEVSGESHE